MRGTRALIPSVAAAVLLSSLALTGCECGGPVEVVDAYIARDDGGSHDDDGGTSDLDGGAADDDGGTSDLDGGAADDDGGGTSDLDGGAADDDGGTSTTDGGTSTSDGGASTSGDGGMSTIDGELYELIDLPIDSIEFIGPDAVAAGRSLRVAVHFT